MEWVIAIFWLVGCPIICAIIADEKGRDGCGWLAAGFFFGIFAVITVIALPANPEVIAQQDIKQGRKKICPHCAETILSAAAVCRYCGRELEMPNANTP